MVSQFIHSSQLNVFYDGPVTRTTALNYVIEMEKAKTPFVTVEKLTNGKYNVIGGFKYIDGIRLLGKEMKIYCLVVDSFKNHIDRLLATLQCSLVRNENIKYKELLVYELTNNFKLTEYDISVEIGQAANKIKKYMYNQIIPKAYLDDAIKNNVKNLIQAIYLANGFSSFEKRLLVELTLYPISNFRFKSKHIALYKRYRKNYYLFNDFAEAKIQIMTALQMEKAIEEYWKGIPHPKSDFDFILQNSINETEDRIH